MHLPQPFVFDGKWILGRRMRALCVAVSRALSVGISVVPSLAWSSILAPTHLGYISTERVIPLRPAVG